ncbi:MAG: helicase-related protein [Thermogutta sp.]
MPRIFDNIDLPLLGALKETLQLSTRSDFCVGYFNLRGWRALDCFVERWPGGEGNCCRLLVGMQRPPEEELRVALRLAAATEEIDNQTALRIKKSLAEHFRNQLMIGFPTNEDEAGLRRLAAQIKAKKLVVKLFVRHPLHAKLYLLFRPDPVNPIVGFLGSSNLTMLGLSAQGELNIDVLDHDATQKLARWFEDRWTDRWCIDISKELVEIVEQSWAREDLVSPYFVYLKMAYHLSRDARAGLTEFHIPRDFRGKLFEFQEAAVKIAAHHLNKRGGVVIGDVVGLGKTLMATCLARIFEDDHGLSTLIVCPKNLVPMWRHYVETYGMRAKVLSISRAIKELPNVPARFRLVIIDESHNLRNRESKTYRAIHEYVSQSESRCILLTATPYNKTYRDLSNQIRLFVPEDKDIGIRPEKLLRELGEVEFIKRHQCPVRSLAAFEKSEYADDWRDLMRLYLVRRTRSFIQDNYAATDPANGRKFLTFPDGRKFYFPRRDPKTVKFAINDDDPGDQYARLYSDAIVNTINRLELPRYGLGNYLDLDPEKPPSNEENKQIQNLSRAGKRLMGFCRTNLFKRLESCGQAFIQSVERHILRNFIYLYAIENDRPLPIGTQDSGMLDARLDDEDREMFLDDEGDEENDAPESPPALRTEADFRAQAEAAYALYAGRYKRRFKWLRPDLFVSQLAADLKKDAKALLGVLKKCGVWDPDRDAKLDALEDLLVRRHPNDKVLVFSQFADTVRYLRSQLRARGINRLEAVTGNTENPTAVAWRFSPVSNDMRERVSPGQELRVVIATDILSEGQNLQDCSVVVNFDLPWAIIRLIQRAGRVDRMGQQAEIIRCYSFLPADGVERIIRLRSRVRQRLKENAEVVGTDESFFEDDRNDDIVRHLFTEKAGILDGDDDTEVDLSSFAYQIWKNAIDADPKLAQQIEALPNVIYATKPHSPAEQAPEGVLAYIRTGQGNDALAWIDRDGNSVSESQYKILLAAACDPDTPALPRQPKHHQLVQKAVERVTEEERSTGGQLGRPSGARFRIYERLKRFLDEIQGTLFNTVELAKAVQEIYRFPLRQTATDVLNRQLRSGISDEELAELVLNLREDNALCLIQEEQEIQDPQIICTMGLVRPT